MVVPPVRAFPSHGPFSPGSWCVPAEERREGSPEGEVLAAFSGEVTLVSRPPPGTGGNPKRCMRRPCSLAASSGGGGRTSDLFFSSGVQTPHFTALARMDQDETRPPRLRGCRERRLNRSGNWYISCRTLGSSERQGYTERGRECPERVVVRIRAKRERVRQSSPIHPLHSNHPRGLFLPSSASRKSRPPW